MSKRDESRIDCSIEARELVKSQKRGGESYDEVLPKMVDQYDPEQARQNPASDVRERGNA